MGWGPKSLSANQFEGLTLGYPMAYVGRGQFPVCSGKPLIDLQSSPLQTTGVHWLSRTLAALILCHAIASAQTIGSCPVLPANSIWNTPVDQLSVASNSETLKGTIGLGANLHADFGSGTYQGSIIGIPFVTVSGSAAQTKYSVTFHYADQSDPGPYAVPLNAPIEGGSDRHVIAVDTDNCILYELYAATPGTSSWTAGSGAIYDLRSNALRPAGWTSADAAGLPIFPGLVRFDEVSNGAINHAIRLTVPQTQDTYVWPARHEASSLTGSQYPSMGQRFRLRASFDISTYSTANQVILKALKKYGMIVADNGTAWFISGAPNDGWNNDDLGLLRNVVGSDFEAVDDSVFTLDPNSGQARSCDLNADGTVNSADMQLSINAALGLSSCVAPDIDGNGICNAVDVQRVILAALALGCHIGP